MDSTPNKADLTYRQRKQWYRRRLREAHRACRQREYEAARERGGDRFWSALFAYAAARPIGSSPRRYAREMARR